MALYTPAEVWPEHAGHDIRYVRHLWQEYTLISIEMEPGLTADLPMQYSTFSEQPVHEEQDRESDTEFICATCNEDLNADHLTVEKP